mmetsp:Transcript_88118/g.190748  ORF Transcript_88118/g.190748 Transcript_88118/m.190748 type:complete len:254 (-) Transcript_88118:159-920(-)
MTRTYKKLKEENDLENEQSEKLDRTINSLRRNSDTLKNNILNKNLALNLKTSRKSNYNTEASCQTEPIKIKSEESEESEQMRKLDLSGLETINSYKNEIELFGLLMKSPELFVNVDEPKPDAKGFVTNVKERNNNSLVEQREEPDQNNLTKSSVKTDRNDDLANINKYKAFAQQQFEKIKRKFGDQFKTYEEFMKSNLAKMHQYVLDENFKSVIKNKDNGSLSAFRAVERLNHCINDTENTLNEKTNSGEENR